jgi:hypothetical protein
LEQAVTLDSVQSTVQGIVAEVVGGLGDPARSWTIEVKTDNTLQVGKINGQIRLNFSSGTLNVPIIGTVKPIIQAIPACIQLSSKSTKPIERLVMLRSGDGRPFEIIAATLENGKGDVDVKKQSDDRWQIKLSVIPATLSKAASVQIQTSCKSQPTITVPLSVR